MSRKSGLEALLSTFSRTGVSVRTSLGEYATDDPNFDHRGLALLDSPLLLELLERLPPEEYDEGEYDDGDEYPP
ncbi:hypothetical protein [Pseudoalteromonas aliena]|uniref:hypothetical protein n=1 Tax=Pseudoalteromonas aliena TaxID=247523 RepID=UPI002494C7E1|nr:hypothetical protein [Pseudoalteromonas aliena]